MEPKAFFTHPHCTAQRHYEALKAFYLEGLSATEAGAKFGFSAPYFKKLRFAFVRDLRAGLNPFFIEKKPGPKQRRTPDRTLEQIIALRKHNYSITDIKSALEAEGKTVSLETIDEILKAEGFAPCQKELASNAWACIHPRNIRPRKAKP